MIIVMAQAKTGSHLERKKASLYEKVDLWQGKLARLLVILLICVQPLYLNHERYVRLTGHKYTFFVVSMCVVLFGVLVIWAYRLLNSPQLLPQGRIAVVDWVVLGFAFITILSALLSPYKEHVNVWVGIPEPGGRYDGAITQLMFVAAYFIVSRWYRPRERDFVVFGISAIIIALLGVLQFYGMDFLRLWPNHIPEYYHENFYNIFFRTTLGNINIVATYVCIAVLLCGFLYLKVNSKWRYLWLAASALSLWMMIIGSSFSGMVGTAAAMVLAIPFFVENWKVFGRFLVLMASWLAVRTAQWFFFNTLIMESRTAASLLPFAAGIIVLLAAGLLLQKFSKEPDPDAPFKWKHGVILLIAVIAVGIIGVEIIGGRAAEAESGGMIYEARQILHGDLQDTFGTNRVYIWRNALRALPNAPVIGTGPDTFFYAFPAEAHGLYGENYDKAHSEYIQILICQGILGLLAYLVFLVGAFVKAIPKVFKNPMLMAVVVTFAGYCVQAIFNISLPIVSQVLWVLVGMMMNKRFLELIDEGRPEKKPL